MFSCACATRVDARTASAIMPAITKALVFMGTSSFLFAGSVQADLSFTWFAYLLSGSSCSATLTHPSRQDNALAVNWEATVGEQVSRQEQKA